MFRFAIFSIVFFLNQGLLAHPNKENSSNSRKPHRWSLRHIESGGIGYENGYTTLEAFFTADPNEWKMTPFLDGKGHIFDNGKWAANLGIGLRALWKNRGYGINTYYDYRNTGRFHSNQIGAGFETLGELFDFRMNGYLPIGTKTSVPYDTAFKEFVGNYMFLSQKIQSAMKGANAEFGFHFKHSTLFNFYAAGGPYYFIGKKTRSTWGGKVRISGTFKEMLTLEISDSFDKTFHNKFQGQISLNFPFGSQSKIRKQERLCKAPHILNDRLLQPVSRQEIIIIDHTKKKTVAVDPTTGFPYFFVFVDNTSQSNGTYESPYHSLAQAQTHSSPNDIIYVFPGDGTSTGMDSGIILKENQKFWGSGVNHLAQTSAGMISIPPQSSASPTITNTNIDTEGNAITVANHNIIRGFNITSAINDGIYGSDVQELDVSSCSFEHNNTYAIEASFPSEASISFTNNQFLNNANGILVTLNHRSHFVCLNNTFKGQTSVSSVPIEIAANSNVFTAQIENNTLDSNTTGSLRFNLTDVLEADINVLNNTITNNGTGSQASLGSSLVVLSNGTVDHCKITLKDNLFSHNTSNAVYLHTAAQITTLEITAIHNSILNHGGSGFVLATPVDQLTVLVTDNLIQDCLDNGIAIIASGSTTTGNLTINRNTITEIGNASNGIALNQDFSTLSLQVVQNVIDGCEGTGIVSYAPTGIGSFKLNVSDNLITNCENLSSNAASGVDIEQYTTLSASITNNILSGNTGIATTIGSTLIRPSVCLTLMGNQSSTAYLLINPVDGLFHLTPCNVDLLNVGTINNAGIITHVQSCSNPTPCPP